MIVDDLDIQPGKISEGVERIIDAATAAAHRYGHDELTTTHLFLGFMQAQWNLFAEVMRDLGADPHAIVLATEEVLAGVRTSAATGVRVPQTTRLVVRLALQRASRAGRPSIEPVDLFVAVLEEAYGETVGILRQYGIDPDVLVERVVYHARKAEFEDQRLAKRLELPPYLKQFGVSLNMLARQDKLPPVFGREREIRQILEILSHRDRANSVMLLGEAGVGKTAVVEGLAHRIELEPDGVPLRLRDCHIVGLQMNNMVAGTMLRGMFEERIQHVITEVRERPNLVLFIDEAHTMVGAGSAMGAPADAANMLKSALARGEVRVIAATTRGEYKEHIEDDEALARRFRCVDVPEPTLQETRQILEKLRPRLERNYTVRILDEAVDTALEMSPRYMRHLHLPDKVIGWLDTAAVRAEMDRRWDVRRDDVVSVISDAAQIPADMVFRDVAGRFADLEARLARRVVGQRKAVRAAARRLVLNKGPLKDGFDRPDGVLLFLGPTGVGKTELAKAVAEALFGDEKKMVRIDMSEYQDPRTGIDKLIGMPRGIVDSPRGGVLTNQLKDNPCTVVLLDEVEKASPEVLNLFLQAFDEGWITDGRGRRVYLSDSIVIMTSNVGSEHFRQLANPLGFVSREGSVERVEADIRRDIERRFTPEFLNRIDEIVLFSPLTRDEAREIAKRYVTQVAATMAASGKTLDVDAEAIEQLVTRGHSPAAGARFLKRVIDEQVKLPISEHWHEASRFRVRVRDGAVVTEPSGPRLLGAASTQQLDVA